ncbi:flagellar hook-length control protein FliK [Vreelandella sp. F11]|uniref:flagellar hook-length control protein FliK n=1 Tax=Vreelandella sp. F11 TaxID=3394751 RepID=UPI0036D9B806
MNIHQLLSVSQSSPQTQSQGAFNRQDPANGLFQQALLHASGTQRNSSSSGLGDISASQAPLQQKQLDALGNLVSDTLEVDAENLSTALEALGLDVSESDFSELLAQLQLPNSDISVDTLGLESEQFSTPLDEIAGRLALMASFTESSLISQQTLPVSPAGLEAIAEQLNVSQTEAAQLVNTPALKAIIQSLSMGSGGSVQSIEPAALKTIAEQLNINQTEASQLASALSGLVGQHQGAQALSADLARSADARSPLAEFQIAPRPQPDTFNMSPLNAATNVSSEALMGALLAADGTPKGSQSGEQLPTGFALNTGSNPLAMPQSAQTYTPASTPTTATLATPFMSPAWSQQLSQQLVQISQRGGDQHVQMQLNPAELGPLSISLKFSEQGAQAHFLSAHAQVRQVLEQAIPQLREALAEQGISLGETSVGEQHDPNDQAFAQSSSKNGTKAGSDSGEVGLDEATRQNAGSNPLVLDGRVDLYA